MVNPRYTVIASVFAAAAISSLILGAAATSAFQPSTPNSVPIPAAPAGFNKSAARKEFTLIGASSCTAQACHGGMLRKANSPIWGNEYAVWLGTDPHAQAYSDLFQKRSIRMAEMLNLTEGAHRSQRCLVCHSAGMQPADPTSAYTASDGVSCEACHGAASQWVDAHTATTWKNMTAAFQATKGLNRLKNLGERAKKCAECHVGTGDRDGDGMPDRDMNHDLIAAGHPRLNFEFGAYLANYPKHWDEKTWDANGRAKRPAPPADLEARAWAVGQVAVARAAFDLLQGRASAAAAGKEHAVWPELSESSCFDCHHDLQAESWRQQGYEQRLADRPSRRLGQPNWGSWHYPLLPLLAKSPAGGGADALAALKTLQEPLAQLNADPAQVASHAQAAGAALDSWLAKLDASDDPLANIAGVADPIELSVVTRALLRTLTTDGRIVARAEWDGAAQVYLALVALHAAGPEDAALKQSLEQIADALRFTAPERNGASRQLDSPAEFNPRQAIDETLKQINAALPGSAE